MNEFDLYLSPPILWIFRQTVTVSPDLYYRFNGNKAIFTPNREIMPNASYLFHTLSLSVDIDELDYQASYTNIAGESFPRVPQFQAYNPIDASAPFFREAVQVSRYLDLPYKKMFIGKELMQSEAYSNTSISFTQATEADDDGLVSKLRQNRMLGSIYGAIEQTASLVGKPTITFTAIMSGQEITDDEILFKDVISKRKNVSGY